MEGALVIVASSYCCRLLLSIRVLDFLYCRRHSSGSPRAQKLLFSWLLFFVFLSLAQFFSSFLCVLELPLPPERRAFLCVRAPCIRTNDGIAEHRDDDDASARICCVSLTLPISYLMVAPPACTGTPFIVSDTCVCVDLFARQLTTAMHSTDDEVG